MPPSDNDPTKNRGAKPGGPGKPGGRSDGPILDLTAKRVGETASGEKPTATGPTGPAAPEPKPAEKTGAGSMSSPKPAESPKPATTAPPAAMAVKPTDSVRSGEITAGVAKPGDIAPAETKPTAPTVPELKPTATRPSEAAAPKPAGSSGPVSPAPGATGPAPTAAAPSAIAARPGSGTGASAGTKAPDATAKASESAAKGPTAGPGAAGRAPAQPATTTRPAETPARRGGLGALAAGLLGGVVGAGLVYGAQFLLPADTNGSDGRIAALEGRLDALARKDAVAALDARVGTAESRIGQAADAAKTAGDEAKAARDAAARAPSAATPADTGRLDALDKRMEGLDAAVKALPSAETVRGAEQRVAALEEQGRTRAQALSAAEAQAKSAAEAAAANGRRLDEQAALASSLGGRVDALGRDVAGRAEASRLQAGLRVVVADRVATALALGQPYAEALSALKGLDVGQANGNLAMLEAYAGGGAPTVQGLAREFRPLAERIETAQRDAAQRSTAATGSITDRLASMAGSIVSVRRVGDAPVSSGPNPLSRVQAALDRGDLAEAAKAWDALPDGARAASAEFGATLKRRAAADEAARAISTAALGALSAPAR